MPPESTEFTPEPSPDPSPDCLAAHRAIARFLDGGLPRAEDRRFRYHLMKCPDCMGIYRQTMAAAAGMGRALREDKEHQEKVSRRAAQHNRVLEATGDGKRRNRFGLRLALVPAGLALLFILVRAGGGGTSLFVHWGEGKVLVGDSILGESLPVFRLEAGDWLATESRARALFRSAAKFSSGAEEEGGIGELAPDSELLVIDPKRREVRLQRGALELAGPGRVQTIHGVCELTGRVRVAVTSDFYVVECLEGEAEWIGPGSVQKLIEGDRVESSVLEDVVNAVPVQGVPELARVK